MQLNWTIRLLEKTVFYPCMSLDWLQTVVWVIRVRVCYWQTSVGMRTGLHPGTEYGYMSCSPQIQICHCQPSCGLMHMWYIDNIQCFTTCTLHFVHCFFPQSKFSSFLEQLYKCKQIHFWPLSSRNSGGTAAAPVSDWFDLPLTGKRAKQTLLWSCKIQPFIKQHNYLLIYFIFPTRHGRVSTQN